MSGGRVQQQQQNQNKKRDLRDASKATRVALSTRLRDAVGEKDAESAQLATAAFLATAFIASAVAMLFDMPFFVLIGSLCVVFFYSSNDPSDASALKKTAAAGAFCALAIAKLYLL